MREIDFTGSIRAMAGSLVLLVGLTGNVCAASPVLVSFSSTGGSPVNKEDNQDIMYLINQGASLSFNVTFDQPVSYTWTVNKSDQQTVTTPANSDTFNWTVPGESGIWEIHLKCWNGTNEEAHKEWVVSTLSPAEAPDFFDSFTDLEYLSGRTQKDPWDRALSEWAPYNNNPAYIVLGACRT